MENAVDVSLVNAQLNSSGMHAHSDFHGQLGFFLGPWSMHNLHELSIRGLIYYLNDMPRKKQYFCNKVITH